MISVNDLKTGLTLELDNGLWSVVEFLHVKPGKGAAFVRSKLKNVETGQVVEKTFRAGEKVAKATLDRREMQYLYKEGAEYVMMDNETYDQLHLTEDQIGDGTAQGGTKPAKLETGAVVNVPFFVSNGDVIRVDTRSNEYLDRV